MWSVCLKLKGVAYISRDELTETEDGENEELDFEA
jgi:hypothetical protein